MDDLLRELQQPARRKRGPQCGVQRVLQLVAEDRGQQTATDLQALIDSNRVDPLQITQTLARYGYDVSVHTVRRHRRRASGEGCACR